MEYNVKRLLFAALFILLICSIALAGPVVKLKHSSFDPLTSTRKSEFAKISMSDTAPDGKRYYIVQFQGPILEKWKAEAMAAGAEILDYIPDFAFVVRATPSAENKLAALPYIRWIGDYATEYRLSPLLPKSGTAEVVIRIFPGADKSQAGKKIAEAGGKLDTPKAELGRNIKASIPAAALLRIAKAAGIAWIEPKPVRKLHNSAARGIMNVGNVWSDLGLYGAGQTVAISDTGLDKGSLSTLAPDFLGRVTKAYALGRTNDWSDDNGHGTHVAGSLMGNGAQSGGNPATHNYTGSFAGVAPEASLVFQSIMDKFGYLTGLPYDLNNLFINPYNDGARIHSNSWGDEAFFGQYTLDAHNTDEFMWGHKDMLVLFAAGNDGVDTNPANGLIDVDNITPPATAKNILCVGATETIDNSETGTWGAYWPGTYPANPISSDRIANNASGMAAFSSRGPCDDGRIKPDICAPGTNIISVRSKDSKAGALWGVYSPNSNYLYSGGTSMATPLVAGACALAREYYVKKGITPSAALIKATLLNGAFDMTPGQYSSPQEIPARPNSVEGWGRLDLKNSILPASPKLIYPFDATSGISTGGAATFQTYNMSSSTPLKVTLVWTDYPASSGATVALVNDLDLTVTTPTGTVISGNGAADRRNNVEGVDFNSPQVGAYTISVTGYNVPHGPQPYALVISGAVLPGGQPTVTAKVSTAKEQSNGATVFLMNKTVSAGTNQFNNFFYIQEPDRSSGIRVQYGPGGGPSVTAGMTVSVAGTITTAAGERVIKDPIVLF